MKPVGDEITAAYYPWKYMWTPWGLVRRLTPNKVEVQRQNGEWEETTLKELRDASSGEVSDKEV